MRDISNYKRERESKLGWKGVKNTYREEGSCSKSVCCK